MSPYGQAPWDVRCEFGPRGLAHIAASADAVVIIDVLSFTTAVSVAVDGDARVFPFRWKDGRAQRQAEQLGASLAGGRGTSAVYSLSPPSLRHARPGERIVLPSLNGATLSMEAPLDRTYAGCLRNAAAVARQVQAHGPRIALVAAGERWNEDGSLRPCIEDWIGAGAIASLLPGTRSPEAELAVAAWERAVHRGVLQTLLDCAGGVELAMRGYADDVRCAAEVNASDWAPRLQSALGSGEEEGRHFARSISA